MAKRSGNSREVLVVALGVVMFWRGAWFVMDYFLFPENVLLSGLVSLAGGIVGLWCCGGMGRLMTSCKRRLSGGGNVVG